MALLCENRTPADLQALLYNAQLKAIHQALPDTAATNLTDTPQSVSVFTLDSNVKQFEDTEKVGYGSSGSTDRQKRDLALSHRKTEALQVTRHHFA